MKFEDIDTRLLSFIRGSIEKEDYTGAIIDSFFFLANLIREKTGLESDGVSLIGQALGGDKPKLKLNNLRTESEKDIQRGIETILRGLFTAIRNPRSHRKVEDSKQDMEIIILFLDYLLKIIDKSKSQFSIEHIAKRVFDKDFVESDQFALLIIKEIPQQKRYPVLEEIYSSYTPNDNLNKVKIFITNLMKKITKEERLKFFNLVSEELKFVDSIPKIRFILSFIANYWDKIEISAKLRIENKLIKALANGRFTNKYQSLNDAGAFATWLPSIINKISLKEQLINTMIDKIDSNDNLEIDYILKYFKLFIVKMIMNNDNQIDLFINSKLADGDERFYNLIRNIKGSSLEQYKENLKNFKKEDLYYPEEIDYDAPF